MTESAETDENIVTSDKEHHDNLSYHHSDKHAERINRSITDTWRIAIQRLVGVSKRHRIRHTSTEDSADTAEVILLGLQDDETYDNHRHNRDEEADATHIKPSGRTTVWKNCPPAAKPKQPR